MAGEAACRSAAYQQDTAFLLQLAETCYEHGP